MTNRYFQKTAALIVFMTCFIIMVSPLKSHIIYNSNSTSKSLVSHRESIIKDTVPQSKMIDVEVERLPSVPERQPSVPDEEIYTVVSERPGFPGGIEAIYKFLQENIKYPALAKENRLSGTVPAKWVVEKDGSVGEVVILRDPGMGMGEAVKQVIKTLPKFTPAKQNGKPVRYWYNAPFKFNLNDGGSK